MKRNLKKITGIFVATAMLSASLVSVNAARVKIDYVADYTEDFQDGQQNTEIFPTKLIASWAASNASIADQVGVNEEKNMGDTKEGNYAYKGFISSNEATKYTFGKEISSTENKYYVQFDFKTYSSAAAVHNMDFAMTNGTAMTPTVSTSYQGYMAATTWGVSSNALAGNTSAPLLNNPKAYWETYKNEAWAAPMGECLTYAKGTWYKVKFLMDKTDNTISVYINDKLYKTKTVDDVEKYNKLVFVNEKSSQTATNTWLWIDNFEVGHVVETEIADIDVTNATLDSATGTVSVTFDDDVDEATLNEETVVIFDSEEYVVGYSNASYNQASKTWTATIDDFSKYSDYTLMVSGAKGIYGNTVNEYSKTFDGEEEIAYIPVTKETFDNQSNELGMDAPYLSPTYDEKADGDYCWRVGFPKNDNGLYAITNQKFISSEADKYYVEFDFMTDVCDNFSIAPIDGSNIAASLAISMSRHGYMIGTLLRPTVKGLNNDSSVLESATVQSWMQASAPITYEANKWYKGKFVFDKTTNTIDAYINGVLCKSRTVADVSVYNRLMIYSHYSGSNNTPKRFSIDNVTVGYVDKPITESKIVLANTQNQAVDSVASTDSIYVNADILNNSEETKNYVVFIASYDKDGCCIDVKFKEVKNVDAGEVVTVRGTELGFDTLPSGAKTVQAFLWSDWDHIKPITPCATVTVSGN